MAIDVNNFLHSLATLVAAAASVHYATGSPRQLWIGRAVEASAADPYAAMTIYPGPGRVWDPQQRLSIQVRSSGTDGLATMALAQKLFEALCDADGVPWQMKQVTGWTVAGASDGHWRIVSIEFRQGPGNVAPDDRGRAEVVFNFDVGFFKEAS